MCENIHACVDELRAHMKSPAPIGTRLIHWSQLVNGLYKLADEFETAQYWVEAEVVSETREHLCHGIELAFNMVIQEGWTTNIGYPTTYANLYYLVEYWERRLGKDDGDDRFIVDPREVPWLIKETNRLLNEYNYFKTIA